LKFHSEVPPIGTDEFTRQLFPLREAFGISDVLIQTESQVAIEEMLQFCGMHGFRLHYTQNHRPNRDVWTEVDANMTEEGRIAALNLIVGSRGAAVVGSFHSAWLKVMPAFMIADQWRPVLAIGLAGQDFWTYGSYAGSDPARPSVRDPAPPPGTAWPSLPDPPGRARPGAGPKRTLIDYVVKQVVACILCRLCW